jgi:cation transport protein ChaC
MANSKEQMRLSPELVALCHREVAEPEPDLRYDYFTEEDYVRELERLLSERPEGPFWIFAYGSLIWKPEFPAMEIRPAVAHGWHRTFAMKIKNYRGTPDQPGYMMCLDHGGRCEGVILRLAESDVAEHIRKLLFREVGSHEAMDSIRWIEVETADGQLTALTTYAHPHRLDFYEKDACIDQVANALARACGHWGSGAEYLYNTVSHLEERGIHDDFLWQLQERVAREIEILYGLGSPPSGN